MLNASDLIQDIANISTTVALIIAITVFIVETKRNRKAREYESFLVLLENYQRIVEQRKNTWKTIKEVLKDSPVNAVEVHDKQNSLDYLLVRLKQNEPMYAVEHGLLDREIRSLNYLDKLCELALNNTQAYEILLLTDAHEISYYQSRLKDLVLIYSSQRSVRLFPKPRHTFLLKVNVKSFFG